MRFVNKIGMAAAAAALFGSLAALPATAAEPGSGFSVASSADEVRTGLKVVKGQALSIKGQGEVTYGVDWSQLIGRYATFFVHPDGARHFAGDDSLQLPKYDSAAVAPTAPVGGLIYRIGSGPWAAVPLFGELPDATTSGELILSVNDVPGQRENNTGSFDVQVQLGFDVAIGE